MIRKILSRLVTLVNSLFAAAAQRHRRRQHRRRGRLLHPSRLSVFIRSHRRCSRRLCRHPYPAPVRTLPCHRFPRPPPCPIQTHSRRSRCSNRVVSIQVFFYYRGSRWAMVLFRLMKTFFMENNISGLAFHLGKNI